MRQLSISILYRKMLNFKIFFYKDFSIKVGLIIYYSVIINYLEIWKKNRKIQFGSTKNIQILIGKNNEIILYLKFTNRKLYPSKVILVYLNRFFF